MLLQNSQDPLGVRAGAVVKGQGNDFFVPPPLGVKRVLSVHKRE
jgi:hypothetical protein